MHAHIGAVISGNGLAITFYGRFIASRFERRAMDDGDTGRASDERVFREIRVRLLASWHFAAARSGTISQISPLQISPGKLRHRFASILAVKEEAHIAHKRTHDCTHVAYSIHSGSTSSSARVQDASATTIQMPQNVNQLITNANDSLDKLRQVRPRRRTDVACSECSKHHRRCEPPEDGQRQCKRCARHNIECSLNRTPAAPAPQESSDSSLAHQPTIHASGYPYNPGSPIREYSTPHVVSSHNVPSNYGVANNPGQVSGYSRYHDPSYGQGSLPLQTGQWSPIDAGPGRGAGNVGASHTLPAVNMSATQPGQRTSHYQPAQAYPANWSAGGMRTSVPPINTAYGEYPSERTGTPSRQSWAAAASPTVGTPQRRDSGFTPAPEYLHHTPSMPSQGQGLYITTPTTNPYEVHQASPIQQHPHQRYSEHGQMYIPDSNSSSYYGQLPPHNNNQ